MLPHLDLLEWGPHSENMCIQLHPSNIDPWPNRAPDCPEDRGQHRLNSLNFSSYYTRMSLRERTRLGLA